VRTRVIVATTIIGLALASGCSSPDYIEPNPSESTMPTQQQYSELMSRPDIEEVVARYEEMREKIKSRLGSELGIANWEDKQDGRQSGCTNEFPGVDSRDAARKFLSFLISSRSVPVEQWSAAKNIVSEIGGQYGFTQAGVNVDKPPHFEFELKDQHKAQLSLSTEKTTVLSVETGCHLTPDAKKRGAPRPSA
jgi:hypothetical protein